MDVRVAGSLVLLFGQHLSRIACLDSDRIGEDDNRTTLVLDRTPVLLPEPLAALVLQLRDHRHTARQHVSTETTSCLLFSGRPASHPISAEPLRKRLARYGIHARAARNTALAEFAADLPAPVLADLLGLHIATAVTWTKTLQCDWTAYLEARVTSRIHPGLRRCRAARSGNGNSVIISANQSAPSGPAVIPNGPASGRGDTETRDRTVGRDAADPMPLRLGEPRTIRPDCHERRPSRGRIKLVRDVLATQRHSAPSVRSGRDAPG